MNLESGKFRRKANECSSGLLYDVYNYVHSHGAMFTVPRYLNLSSMKAITIKLKQLKNKLLEIVSLDFYLYIFRPATQI